METATCVLTCKYWFSMSRITCLIIFSGSSARSIMSLRFARIKVPTRSKSPMVFLLPRKSLRMRAKQDRRGHLEDDPRNNAKSTEIFDAGEDSRHQVADQERHQHRTEDPDNQKLFLECHLIPRLLESAAVR